MSFKEWYSKFGVSGATVDSTASDSMPVLVNDPNAVARDSARGDAVRASHLHALRDSLIHAEARLVALEALVRTGAGSPEGAVAAPVGTIYLRTDGDVSTTLYVKQTGTGNTGWGAK